MRTQLFFTLVLSFFALACGGDDDGTSDAGGGGGRDSGNPVFDDDAGPGEDDLPVPLTLTLGTLPMADTRFAALCQTWVGEGEIAYSLVAEPNCVGGELYMYFVHDADKYTVLSGYRMNASTGERGDILRIESTSVGMVVGTEMGYFVDDLPEDEPITLATDVHSLLRFRFVGDELTIIALRPR